MFKTFESRRTVPSLGCLLPLSHREIDPASVRIFLASFLMDQPLATRADVINPLLNIGTLVSLMCCLFVALFVACSFLRYTGNYVKGNVLRFFLARLQSP